MKKPTYFEGGNAFVDVINYSEKDITFSLQNLFDIDGLSVIHNTNTDLYSGNYEASMLRLVTDNRNVLDAIHEDILINGEVVKVGNMIDPYQTNEYSIQFSLPVKTLDEKFNPQFTVKARKQIRIVLFVNAIEKEHAEEHLLDHAS